MRKLIDRVPYGALPSKVLDKFILDQSKVIKYILREGNPFLVGLSNVNLIAAILIRCIQLASKLVQMCERSWP